MRIAKVPVDEGEVARVQRQTSASVAAKKSGHGLARRQTLPDGAVEALQVRVRQAIQWTAAVVAGDRFVVLKGDDRGTSRRNAAHQQSADLRTARTERAEIFNRVPFETVHQIVGDPHGYGFPRNLPRKEGRRGSRQIEIFCARRGLCHRMPPPVPDDFTHLLPNFIQLSMVDPRLLALS